MKLADLEYAKRITKDEPVHAGIRTVCLDLFVRAIALQLIVLTQGTEDFMSIEVRSQKYCFVPFRRSVKRQSRTVIDESKALCLNAEGPLMEVTIPEVDTVLTRTWFYNPLHDMESIFWIFARQVLYQDHYLCRLDDTTVNHIVVPIGDKAVQFPTTEDPADRVRRIKAYSIVGDGLFVSRTHRHTLLTDSIQINMHLVAHPLFPAVRPLGAILTMMRDTLVEQYEKWEAALDKIDHRCAEELHVAFMGMLKDAYHAIRNVEAGNYNIMARSLQSEMAMIRDQEAMDTANKVPLTNSASGSTTSSKRSRSDADDSDEDAIAHPSKSARTATNHSPRRPSIEDIDSLPVVTVPRPAPVPKAGPKRTTRVVPFPTRTLRSHTLKVVKAESTPQPSIPSLPPPPNPAAAHGRKTASRGRGKATKNNDAVRAAAKVAAKVKNKTRKGR